MDSKTYWKYYYEKNKDRLNEKKRQRYKTDATYREALLTNAKLRATLYRASSKLARKDLIKTVYGIEEKPYSLKAMSRIAGIYYDVIRKWFKAGYIPQPLYYNGKRALYSESQVLYFKDFIEELKKNDAYLTYADIPIFLNMIWTIPYKGKEYSKEIISKLSEVRKNEKKATRKK